MIIVVWTVAGAYFALSALAWFFPGWPRGDLRTWRGFWMADFIEHLEENDPSLLAALRHGPDVYQALVLLLLRLFCALAWPDLLVARIIRWVKP